MHLLLYAAMIVLPITGWSIISAHPPQGSPGWAAERAASSAVARPGERGRSAHYVWGTVRLPLIPPVQEVGRTPGGLPPLRRIHDDAVDWHGTLALVTLALLALHLAGALKHQLFDGQDELGRMGIRLSQRSIGRRNDALDAASW